MEPNSLITELNTKLKQNNSFDILGFSDDDKIVPERFFYLVFGELYSTHSLVDQYDIRLFAKQLIKTYKVKQNQVVNISNSKGNRINFNECQIMIVLKKGLGIYLHSYGIRIYYCLQISLFEIKKLIDLSLPFQIKQSFEKRFYMIEYSYNDFSLLNFKAKPFTIDVTTNYNDDFLEIDELIRKSLKEGKNGLLLLHGKYGTGKTFYIRHLINTIDRKFIYLPNNMVEFLSSPGFLPFIAKYQNSVLILEDCESILIKRTNSSNGSSALSNLLNLGDGLLADALNINVICTFNAEVSKIDDAILRKGRLIAKYEFDNLEIGKAQKLANTLGYNQTITKTMSLSEIHKLGERNFENIKMCGVGFK